MGAVVHNFEAFRGDVEEDAPAVSPVVGALEGIGGGAGKNRNSGFAEDALGAPHMDIAGEEQVGAGEAADQGGGVESVFAGGQRAVLEGDGIGGDALADDPGAHGGGGLGVSAEDDAFGRAFMPDVDGVDAAPIGGLAHHGITGGIADGIAAEDDENGGAGIGPGSGEPLGVPGGRNESDESQQESEKGE